MRQDVRREPARCKLASPLELNGLSPCYDPKADSPLRIMSTVADDSTTQIRFDDEQLARAAAFVLKSVASDDGLLYRCISAIEQPRPAIDGVASLPVEALESALPSGFVHQVTNATHVPTVAVLSVVVDQLKRVARFARSDGGELRDNLKAVERLIRSGRLDLFAY